MAEFAEESLEKLLPAFEAIKSSRLLDQKQFNAFVQQCNRFEYRLQKRTKSPLDYELYVAHLKNFIVQWKELVAKEKRKIHNRDTVICLFKRKIAWLYKIRSERFKKAEYYLEEARFARKGKLVGSASEAYSRLLQIHSTNPDYYCEAASFEARENRSFENARTILQLGLRKYPENLMIWTYLFRTELRYVKYIKDRRNKLLANDDKKSVKSAEEKTQGDEELVDEEVEDKVLRLDLARIVLKQARESIPEASMPEFLQCCKKISDEHSVTGALSDALNVEKKAEKHSDALNIEKKAENLPDALNVEVEA